MSVLKVKVKVSLFNVGSSVSSYNCYQWRLTVRPLPPPSVSAPILRVFKATATQIREKSEQTLESLRMELGTSSTEGSALTNCATRLLLNIINIISWDISSSWKHFFKDEGWNRVCLVEVGDEVGKLCAEETTLAGIICVYNLLNQSINQSINLYLSTVKIHQV